jgi:hypothetical protein
MKEENKLKKLLNKEFIYKQDNIRIENYVPDRDSGDIDIITDKKPIRIKEDGIQKFIDMLLPVEEPQTKAVSTISAEVIQEATGLTKDLKDILLDNIKKVQTDPNYIKQATTINKSVNSLVSLAKLHLEAAVKLKR